MGLWQITGKTNLILRAHAIFPHVMIGIDEPIERTGVLIIMVGLFQGLTQLFD